MIFLFSCKSNFRNLLLGKLVCICHICWAVFLIKMIVLKSTFRSEDLSKQYHKQVLEGILAMSDIPCTRDGASTMDYLQ